MYFLFELVQKVLDLYGEACGPFYVHALYHIVMENDVEAFVMASVPPQVETPSLLVSILLS